MTFHSEVMNMPRPLPGLERNPINAYKNGHRDARHDAAEIAARADAEIARLHEMVDALLAHCPNGECHVCSVIICPHKHPFHFHHDGCPACAELGANHEPHGMA